MVRPADGGKDTQGTQGDLNAQEPAETIVTDRQRVEKTEISIRLVKEERA